MAVSGKFKNRRRWQEVGAAVLLLFIIAVPTMVFAAYVPEAIGEWKNIRRDYGPGTAYALIAVFGVLTALLAIPATAFVLQTRGGVDWLLGEATDSDGNRSDGSGS